VDTPSTVVIIPLWRQQTGTWISGFIAQNTTNQTANGSVIFFDANGNRWGSIIFITIQPFASYQAFNVGPADGSAVLHSDQPIAVVVNQSLNTSGDGAMRTPGRSSVNQMPSHGNCGWRNPNRGGRYALEPLLGTPSQAGVAIGYGV
jgi:hypothetical protein